MLVRLWQEDLKSSLQLGLSTVLRSLMDAWQSVLTGAIFDLVGQAPSGGGGEVEAPSPSSDSPFLHLLCAATFGYAPRRAVVQSVICGLMLVAAAQGACRAVGERARIRL